MKVSIIVPVYNGEKYIKRCMESILNQTYRDLEIIAIDDGSTDKSYKILENINDERIKLYRKKNSGVSDTRNFGIQKVSGQAMMFVDIDDYIHLELVKKLVDKFDKNKKTFVLCDNKEIYKNNEYERVLFNDKDINLDKNLDKNLIMRSIANGVAGLVCCKLVSSEIVHKNQIKFNKKILIGEDQVFFLQVAQHCEKFSYVNESLYFYDRRNESSATMKYQENLIDNFIILQSEVEKVFRNNNLDNQIDIQLLNQKLFNNLIICLINEVKYLKMKDSIKNIKTIVQILNTKINHNLVKVNGFYELLLKEIKKNNRNSYFKIWILIKIFLIKQKL